MQKKKKDGYRASTALPPPCWEGCAAPPQISTPPRATIAINLAGFDVQALIPCDSLDALSHNNLDDYHSGGGGGGGTACFHVWMHLHSAPGRFAHFAVSLPDCGMRLEFGNIKGQAEGDPLHRCLSLFYLIASSWCVCVLGAVFTICSEIDTYLWCTFIRQNVRRFVPSAYICTLAFPKRPNTTPSARWLPMSQRQTENSPAVIPPRCKKLRRRNTAPAT